MKRFLLILSLLWFASCTSDVKIRLIEQEERIDSYLESRFKDSTIVRNGGSAKVIMQRDSVMRDSLGREILLPKLEYGDTLSLYYAGYVFTSSPSTLFATNVKEVAEKAGLDLVNPDYNPLKICFDRGVLIPGLENGLIGSYKMEHSIILFSAEYGFGNKQQYSIPKLSALSYEVWIEDVIKKVQ